MKILLCKLGRFWGYRVDVEQPPDSEVAEMIIRHDVLWYADLPPGVSPLLGAIRETVELVPEYRALVVRKSRQNRYLVAGFEIEASDITTKSMKGDISNLSKLPIGVIVVKRRDIHRRLQRALLEFRTLHGVNNVLIASFGEIQTLAHALGVQ